MFTYSVHVFMVTYVYNNIICYYLIMLYCRVVQEQKCICELILDGIIM
jgi:hypothetical protein